MARVELINFSLKYYGHKKETLSNINLSFDTNEKILLLSPSGYGKSSLLLCLLGIIQRNNLGEVKGKIRIDGTDIEEMSPIEIAKNFGIVFQDPENQFCTMYPEDEIAFSLENFCTPSEKIGEKIDKVLEQVKMKDKKREMLSNLSGGEQQKVAIGSSLAVESKMLLLDEPTANLDTLGRCEINELITSLDIGYLLVEHNFEEWLDRITRAIVIDKNGTIRVDSSGKDFLDKNSDILIELGLSKNTEEDKSICNKMSSNKSDKLLEIKKLNFKYAEKTILNDLSFDVNSGEIVALLGKNGAGKTTLSKILGGMESRFNGEVSYRGKNIKKMSKEKLYSELTYVFQNPEHQFIKDSVRDEIELFKEIHGEEICVDTILDKYNLEGVKNENPFTLSGGQKRRLSVAIMLSKKHNVLILDEPTFGLDYYNTRELMIQIKGLAKKGMGIIIITHNMEIVKEYAMKALVLKEGENSYFGSVKELFENREFLEKAKIIGKNTKLWNDEEVKRCLER
ncbi:ABC transporter ATP-binding protein [Psychrilyobacter atlanticus]|uniref:ABC transporter ATP-binding protein n=1 Tax=Psychrilyobacter atlanticus TaxID=271091 RepID=UPI0004201C7F|nr:ABC transporter ATP-binding protein [Psychrilyobacter atlanticus]